MVNISDTITNIDGDIRYNAAQIEVLMPLKQKTKKLSKVMDQAEANILNIQVTLLCDINVFAQTAQPLFSYINLILVFSKIFFNCCF